MNYIDFIIIILLIISCISGYKKGFVSQLTSLTAVILGFYLAIKFSGNTANWLVAHFSWSMSTSRIVSFVVILILIFVIVGVIGKAIEKTFEEADLGHFNKILGIVFSLAKSIVMLSIITVVLNIYNKGDSFPDKADKHNSLLYMPISSVAPAIFPLFEQNNGTQPQKKF